MIRTDYTKTFSINNSSATYMREIVLPMGREIFSYIDSIIRQELKLKRRDSFGNHETYTTFFNEGEGFSHPEFYSSVLGGRDFIGWYGFDNNDNDILILKVSSGGYNDSGYIYPSEWDNDSPNTNDIYGFHISLFFTRTLLEDGLTGGNSVATREKQKASTDILDVENRIFHTGLIKKCGIHKTFLINPIQKDSLFSTTITLQNIKNGSSSFLTFNNSKFAIPRLGVATVNGLEIKKTFLHYPPVKMPNSSDYWIYLDDRDYIGDVLPLDICILDSGDYRFGNTDLLKDREFKNLGNKIPTMPIFVGTTDVEQPTELDFSKPVDGFYQINKNFKDEVYSQYILNNTSFTNLGNNFLMKD
jgi:hypothetical protein